MRSILLFLLSFSGAVAGGYFPETDASWEMLTAAEAGADPMLLDDAVAYASDADSDALIILKGGRLVTERYWNGANRNTRMSLFSASKSLVASVVGKLLEDGVFSSLDQPSADFLSEWGGVPGKEAITLRHHLSMTTGLEGGKVNLARALQAESERFFATNLPMAHAPATFWTYNNPAYRLLFPIIEEATDANLPGVFRTRLFDPIEMSGVHWKRRREQVGSTTVVNYQYIEATALSAARFGLLAQRNGRWSGTQVVPTAFMAEAVTPSQDLNPSYGFLWWLNGGAETGGHQQLFDGLARAGPYFPDAPPDTFAALGKDDQMIAVLPSLDLVVVRLGADPLGEAMEAVSPAQDVLLGKIARAFGYGGQTQRVRLRIHLVEDFLRLTWSSWVGRSYDLLTSTELEAAAFQPVNTGALSGGGLPLSVDHPRDTSRRFFRVRAAD